jgi:hypothetical protein
MKKLLSWIENSFVKRIWFRIDQSCDSGESDLSKNLATLRIFYTLFILYYSTPQFAWIGRMPNSLFMPPRISPSNLFTGFPDYKLMFGVDVLLILLSIFILLGLKARVSGVIFFCVYVLASSFHYSFGKIDHKFVFVSFILGLSIAGWGSRFAIMPDRQYSDTTQRRILAVLATILCFGMLTAGAGKAKAWIDFDLDTGGFLAWFYSGYFNLERTYFLAPLVLKLPPRFFECFDYFAVVFETTPFVMLLAGRRWWLLWLWVASIFHLSNTLILNIPFVEHAMVYLTFIRFNELINRIKILPHGKFVRFMLLLKERQILVFLIFPVTGITIAIFTNQVFAGNEISSPLKNIFFSMSPSWKLYFSVILWSIVSTCLGFSTILSFRGDRSKHKDKNTDSGLQI